MDFSFLDVHFFYISCTSHKRSGISSEGLIFTRMSILTWKKKMQMHFYEFIAWFIFMYLSRSWWGWADGFNPASVSAKSVQVFNHIEWSFVSFVFCILSSQSVFGYIFTVLLHVIRQVSTWDNAYLKCCLWKRLGLKCCLNTLSCSFWVKIKNKQKKHTPLECVVKPVEGYQGSGLKIFNPGQFWSLGVTC